MKIESIIFSLSFFVLLGIAFGLAVGGFPSYTNEISMASLVIAMILSLSPISLESLSLKKGGKNVVVSLLLNFGLLSILTIAMGMFFPDPIKKGFIIMAAVPPAIAVMPITAILKGNAKYTLISLSSLYVISLALTPLIIIFFLEKEVNLNALIKDIILLIAIPLILSRIFHRISIPDRLSRSIINVCFFLLVFGVVGKNREFIFNNMDIVLLVSVALFIRTFGTGIMVKNAGKRLRLKDEDTLPLSLFASFKNEGMAILFAMSLFSDYTTTIPAIVAIIFEMLWTCCLETRLL